MVLYWILYFVFSGLFTIGYAPLKVTDSPWLLVAYFLCGWAAFPVILGGMARALVQKWIK